MRQSIASARQSQVPVQSSSAVALTKLAEKKKEFEAVAALDRASAKFLKRMEQLGDDFEVMADAGTVCGEVMEQWPNMFRILSHFLASREKSSDLDEQTSQEPTGERLVRVPIEELQTTDS
ncbi:uncharacterized protein PHACADRAFT_257534 [Phanerochaete carnosa HHB-10118-sp]|uniref:DASH complex subunit DAD2 n=1 Tax=Phanerochaete carnosa (strain HHB-10118-sp) TaxID=650164 RepID=K5W4W6_PHACS|nr:uncharacterized protein PHACADRAFT_257523 [Phanerochaete carnosa HHB-10118-sp]XP_007396696.1 uncharacterized protein PHACADRAFT_257534 [Phanerochaete carnosa HHB-10118-sp]EKM53984.1 hypothetical protein PHACADRAFT_257523 [Phanerochaete carnosa HHB-10118-sp]EKM53989.1 hypothetical protein PHACADRAFT_257534 [Phanerochaete carnosa HHB-10118-sp]